MIMFMLRNFVLLDSVDVFHFSRLTVRNIASCIGYYFQMIGKELCNLNMKLQNILLPRRSQSFLQYAYFRSEAISESPFFPLQFHFAFRTLFTDYTCCNQQNTISNGREELALRSKGFLLLIFPVDLRLQFRAKKILRESAIAKKKREIRGVREAANVIVISVE